jgi:CBS domain-containing protein
MMMQVRDIMTRKVISATHDQSVLAAAQTMLQNRISGLPVTDADGKLVGIVTEGDFLRRGEIGTQRQRPRWLEFLIGPGRLASEYVHASGRKVEEVMTPDPYTVTEGDSLEAVVKLMEHRHVKRLPVLRDNRIVGIVSRADVMDAFIELAHYQSGPADDATVRERILAALADIPWAPHVEVKVHDGIAELSAVITDERERNAVIVAVENVGGVKAVHDHMVWVEPMSGVAIPSAEDEAADRAGEPAERAPH